MELFFIYNIEKKKRKEGFKKILKIKGFLCIHFF